MRPAGRHLLRLLVGLAAVVAAIVPAAVGAGPDPSWSASGVGVQLASGPVAAASAASSADPSGAADATNLVDPAGTVGSVSVRVAGAADGVGGASARGTVDASDISLLGGRLRVASLGMAVRARADPGSAPWADVATATADGVAVDGRAVSPVPGSRVDIPGAATAVFFERLGDGPGSIRANALRVEITGPGTGLPVGTELVVGHLEAAATVGEAPAAVTTSGQTTVGGTTGPPAPAATIVGQATGIGQATTTGQATVGGTTGPPAPVATTTGQTAATGQTTGPPAPAATVPQPPPPAVPAPPAAAAAPPSAARSRTRSRVRAARHARRGPVGAAVPARPLERALTAPDLTPLPTPVTADLVPPLPATPAPAPADGGYVFPVRGRVSFTDDYGAPRAGAGPRRGNDIFGRAGLPVLAVADGTLSRVGVSPLGGNRLWLTDNRGNAFSYADLAADAPGVADGMRVRAGQVIGFVGNGGQAAGTPPHLHFEIHPAGGDSIDPYPYLVAWSRNAVVPPATAVAVRSPDGPPPAGARVVGVRQSVDAPPGPAGGLATAVP